VTLSGFATLTLWRSRDVRRAFRLRTRITCWCGSHSLALSRRTAPGPPGVGWSPSPISPTEGAVGAACHISRQDPGVLQVCLVMPHGDKRQDVAWKPSPPSHGEVVKTQSSWYFASVCCAKGARLGVDPDGSDFKANSIPALLSEWESRADRRMGTGGHEDHPPGCSCSGERLGTRCLRNASQRPMCTPGLLSTKLAKQWLSLLPGPPGEADGCSFSLTAWFHTPFATQDAQLPVFKQRHEFIPIWIPNVGKSWQVAPVLSHLVWQVLWV